MNLAPPEELSRPILHVETPEIRIAPSGSIRPTMDGEVTSYFEWLGAGQYRVDERSGSMHGKKFLVKEVFFGSDGASLFVRVDFRPGAEAELPGMEARVTLQSLDGAAPRHASIRLAAGAAVSQEHMGGQPFQSAYCRILEAGFPLEAIGVPPGCGVKFQLSLWQGGLPVDAVPQQGWIELRTTNPGEMGD